MNKTAKVAVGGMMCPKCAARIERALLKIPGIKSCDADVQSQTVCITMGGGCEAAEKTIKEAIEGAGYEFHEFVGEDC